MTQGNPSHRFTDQVVIVTGAGGGIGSAIAERFASEGAQVVVTDVNQELIDATVELVKSQGGDVIGIKADISDEQAAHGLIDQVIEKYGRIDVLCNNAGINITRRIHGNTILIVFYYFFEVGKCQFAILFQNLML